MHTPVLNNFSKNLTFLALMGELDPVIGRFKEIERICQILSRKKKNNPLLIGQPGVGKTAIAEGLAMFLINNRVPSILYNKKIVLLDLISLISGTKYRGQFEERIRSIIREIEINSDIILFIDEIHIIIGAGGNVGSLDVSNILKPALAKGKIQCIGATTFVEYKKYLEKDGALERRFHKIIINPSSEEETIEILHKIKNQYEKYHNVIYTNEAIKACVELTSKYIPERYLPDKAIDVLDESGARLNINYKKRYKKRLFLEKELEIIRKRIFEVIKYKKYEYIEYLRNSENKIEQRIFKEEELCNKNKNVYRENIEEIVSMITNIPIFSLNEDEEKKLFFLSSKIKKEIIGQDKAIEKVVKAIQINRIGLKDPNRPIGSFIFIGDTGVGKTQLAKTLSKELFNSEKFLIRINMNEYIEKFSVSKLIGSPPGYIGYEEGGQLTEVVRRQPYSVILFDEIEKAHSDIFNILLQILDEGFIFDNSGKEVNFKNTIIILTSNLGNREIKDFGTGIGYKTNFKKKNEKKYKKNIIKSSLKRTFSPEFLNRIDDIIIFNSLKKEDYYKIIEIELKKVLLKINYIGYNIIISYFVKKYILKKVLNKNNGVRILKIYIKKLIENIISKYILKYGKKNIKKGCCFFLKLNNKKKIEIFIK